MSNIFAEYALQTLESLNPDDFRQVINRVLSDQEHFPILKHVCADLNSGSVSVETEAEK